jgi:hypothetical protein
MARTVVVYTTRTGHSRDLAEQLAAMIDAPVYEIKDAVGHAGILGFLRGVQPIWASNLSPILRTWLDTHRSELSGVRLAMLASQSGSPPERFRANIESELGGLAAFAVVPERLAPQEIAERLRSFASSLQHADA